MKLFICYQPYQLLVPLRPIIQYFDSYSHFSIHEDMLKDRVTYLTY